MENYGLSFLAIFAAVTALIGALGGGLITAAFTRRWTMADNLDKTKEANAGKLIDADQLALEIFHEEVKSMRIALEGVRDQLDAVKEERAELKAQVQILQNTEKHLTGRIDRQGEKIRRLTDSQNLTQDLLNEAKGALHRSDLERTTLRGELLQMTKNLNDLKRRADQSDEDHVQDPHKT